MKKEEVIPLCMTNVSEMTKTNNVLLRLNHMKLFSNLYLFGSGYFAGPGKIAPGSYFAGPCKVAILDL